MGGGSKFMNCGPVSPELKCEVSQGIAGQASLFVACGSPGVRAGDMNRSRAPHLLASWPTTMCFELCADVDLLQPPFRRFNRGIDRTL
jgi:hypothetical protein